MRIIIFILFILLCFICSCAHSVETDMDDVLTICEKNGTPTLINKSSFYTRGSSYCNKYSIEVDGSFTVSKANIIEKAWKDWVDILDHNIQYEFNSLCSIDDSQDVCTIKVLNVSPEDNNHWGYCTWHTFKNNKTQSAVILLKTDLPNVEIYRVIMHEFGHALNLHHSEDNTSIMKSGVLANYPNCDDRIKVCQYWDCDPKCN